MVQRASTSASAASRPAAAGSRRSIGAAEDDILGALSDRQREQLFELLQKASAGRVPDCAGAAAEPEGDC